MTVQRNGPTTSETALAMLEQAAVDLQSAKALVQGRATKQKKHQAYRLLSGIESSMAILKISLGL